MNVFPTLYTNRLRLRKIHVDDIPVLVQYANNKKITDYILNMPYPYQEPDAVFRISYVYNGFKANTRLIFAIAIKETNTFIGEIALHFNDNRTIAELGYWLGEPLWMNGYTTEAIQAVLKFGFKKLNLELITASCEEENTASVRVLEKTNFVRSGVTGKVLQYTMSRTEYLVSTEESNNNNYMFTVEEIKAAHSKVKSGADFPNYIQDLINLGVLFYETHVSDGHTDYFGKDNYKTSSPPRYNELIIAAHSNADEFKAELKAHQQGKTDYPAFCNSCAATGVASWIVDMDKMTCTYYDTNGNEILAEDIPQAKAS